MKVSEELLVKFIQKSMELRIKPATTYAKGKF